MIQENQVINKVLEEGQSKESIGMTLDADSTQVLMQMLSKNLYSDPIGSTVRECASNALDSHRRAGVNEAIIVSLKINPQNNYEFSVEDFGTGLDADDVENIISKYGKSTKRNSATELGMMGLGFKSPLAYCSSFYFVCRKDGVERKYMMFEGEEVNTIDLLYETPTEERNGVKVIVPVSYNDRSTFIVKIKNQLAYFESVYFDVNVNNVTVENEFQILRSEHYQLSELNTDDYMHICLDNVYYPMDFGKLGINNIQLPVGLRFGLSDGLFPTPNREQLIYSAKAKAIILDKLKLVADCLVNKYNENNIDCKNIHEVFDYYDVRTKNIQIGDKILDVSKVNSHSKIAFTKPIYKKFPLTDFSHLHGYKDYLLYEYKIVIEYYKGQFKQSRNSNYTLDYRKIKDKKKVFVYDEIFTGNKKSYIKSLLHPNSYDIVYFVRKQGKIHLRNKNRNQAYDNYVRLLNLHVYPKDTWRARIAECKQIIAEMAQDFQDVDNTQIPQPWLDARKKKRVYVANGGTKRVKLQGELNCKKAEELQRFVINKSSKLTPDILKVESIGSSKFLSVYGRQKDEKLIDGLYSISGNQKVRYYVLSEREYTVAQTLDIHNFISIEKFMEGKNKPFKRLVTSYLIHCLMCKYNDTFSKVELLRTVSTPMYDQLKSLIDYKNRNYNRIGDEDVYKNLVDIATEHKLFDETIYTEYLEVKELLDTFPFIETTLEVLPYNAVQVGKECYLDVLIDLFKYNRIRINYTNYKLVLNEDIVGEIDEQKIEELTQNN